MTSQTLCPMVWNHQFIDGTGRVKPCCRYQGSIGQLKEDLNETFNSNLMQNLRKEMIAGNRPEVRRARPFDRDPRSAADRGFAPARCRYGWRCAQPASAARKLTA